LDWSAHQDSELEERTGSKSMRWEAVEPGRKHDVRIYLSGDAVGLHITAWH